MQHNPEKPLRERARLEPLDERARNLFTPPREITTAAFAARSAAEQAFLLILYTLQGGKYVLNKAVHELTAAEAFGILKNLGMANGIRMALIAALDATNQRATIALHFFNLNSLDQILATYTANHATAKDIFPVRGGQRLLAGAATGQVQVDSRLAPAPAAIVWPDPSQPVLHLTITPIGDYSTYTLAVRGAEIAPSALFDPLFAEISFKFRPGCFSANCAPEWEASPPPETVPAIDYLAKDYDSFRHTLIAAMMQRVPGWQPTSEADLDQVLLDLFSAAADELSDYQDRVMNEAYLSSARKRVSLARHARLMDYHLHQGNQASTWLALELEITGAPPEFDLLPGLTVWAGNQQEDAASVVFITRTPQHVHQMLNSLGLYTWSGAIPTLAAGSTSADLKLYQQLYLDHSSPITPAPDHDSAKAVRDLIRTGQVRHLLIQERLNPATGLLAGYDPGKRQLLRLLSSEAGAEALQDPITGEWFVRVHWRQEDALQQSYCFTVDSPVGQVENASLFHGNLVEVHHGRLRKVVFKEATSELTTATEFHYHRTPRHGVLCALPDRNLAYLNTPPGGEEPPVSTLKVVVHPPGGTGDPWNEVPSLIHSDNGSENGDHFVVETEEETPGGGRRSYFRFGNGVNGRELPDGAEVHCEYQVGNGLEGNIGADKLLWFSPTTLPVAARVRHCWNPFAVTTGRAPEPAVEVIRRVPEAYRARQLRAVTLADYVKRAEELPGVSRAAASYAWTGSWRTVRVTIDPVGTNLLSDELYRDVSHYLEAVRLIGEDIEIRPPRFVPLKIQVRLCVHPNYWPEDVKFVLEQEFSSGWTPDGRMGFFHPDRWSFGQPLHASQMLGRLHAVTGVEHVIGITMKRWNDPTTGGDFVGQLRPNEILQVRNAPDHQEQGVIEFEVLGGRR